MATSSAFVVILFSLVAASVVAGKQCLSYIDWLNIYHLQLQMTIPHVLGLPVFPTIMGLFLFQLRSKSTLTTVLIPLPYLSLTSHS